MEVSFHSEQSDTVQQATPQWEAYCGKWTIMGRLVSTLATRDGPCGEDGLRLGQPAERDALVTL